MSSDGCASATWYSRKSAPLWDGDLPSPIGLEVGAVTCRSACGVLSHQLDKVDHLLSNGVLLPDLALSERDVHVGEGILAPRRQRTS